MKAKFSLSDLLEDSNTASKRFFIPIILAVLGAAIGIYSFNGNDFSPFIETLLSVIGLGISLFLAIAIFFETRSYSKLEVVLVHLSALVFLVLIFFKLKFAKEFDLENSELLLFRYALIFHLLVSFLPYLGNKSNVGFWHYNRILFTRILLTGIFIAALYLGLAGALGAISTLFDVDFSTDVFFDLWIILFGPVSVIFFCAGIPQNLKSLEENDKYSNILRVFVQFVLIPLVLIYLVIMYFYFGKITFEMELPKGFLTYFINAMVVIGLLAYLLIYPYQTTSKSKIIQIYAKHFFKVLIPVVIVQFIGIFRRIGDYGFTEERYLVLLTTVLICTMIVYFAIMKGKRIQQIPMFIFYFTAFSTFGLSASTVAKWSQSKQIKELLIKNQMFDGKTIKPMPGQLNVINTKNSELYEKFTFMVYEYGITGFEPYLTIRSRSEIRDSLLKIGIKDRYSVRFELKQIQKDELDLKLSKLNIVSNVVEAVDSVVTADRYDYYRIENFNFPFPISKVSEISYLTQIEPAADAKYKATVEKLKNNLILKIERDQKKYEFDVTTLLNRVTTSENKFIVSTNQNNKAVFLVTRAVVDTQKKAFVLIEGQLFE